MATGSPHILIVDDEPFNLDIIEEYLEEVHFSTERAINGEAALDALKATPDAFSVILLDRMMPNKDGMSVLKEIKSNSSLAHLPVIMQSALSTRDDIVAGMEAGAHYYLTKPYDKALFLSVVKTAVGDWCHHKQLRESLQQGIDSVRLLNRGGFILRTLNECRSMATYLASACPSPERSVVGLAELMINAVEHGNLGITYDEKSRFMREGSWLEEVEYRLELPENQKKRVQVDFQRTSEAISICISDEGAGFDWTLFEDLSPDRAMDPHGRGIAMAKLLSFDDVCYEGEGNQVRCINYL